MKKSKLVIGLIFGGRSAEREVSINTAAQIKRHLSPKKYKVLPIEISRSGKWPAGSNLLLLGRKIDLAFIAMHGPYGEDGTIQGLMEMLNIPYTFSGVLASSLAMDKFRAQHFLNDFGILTPRSVLIGKTDPEGIQRSGRKNLGKFGAKLVVKPNRLGSSVGVHVISNNKAAIDKALTQVFRYDDQALAQEFIAGMEITAPILGNDRPRPLPVIEIVPKASASKFYDYKAKYAAGGSQHIIPARLPAALQKKVQAQAVTIHQALGCRGVSRSDFIVTKTGKIYFLETNTIPGMTATSLLPDSAAKIGIKFPDLLDRIIKLARG